MFTFWITLPIIAAYSTPAIIMFNKVYEEKKAEGNRSYEEPDMFIVFIKSCFWPFVMFSRLVISINKSMDKTKTKETTPEEKAKADAEAARQLKALEAVESLLLTPEPTTPTE